MCRCGVLRRWRAHKQALRMSLLPRPGSKYRGLRPECSIFFEKEWYTSMVQSSNTAPPNGSMATRLRELYRSELRAYVGNVPQRAARGGLNLPRNVRDSPYNAIPAHPRTPPGMGGVLKHFTFTDKTFSSRAY